MSEASIAGPAPSALAGRKVRRPIVILGASRSGTSLLARILRHHPDVALMGEPRPIWMYGNAYRSHQALDASHLTPRIARYIDDRFGEFLQESGRSRFAEKTPSNCLRIPFVYALYPDAKMVNIIRDGRLVVRSQVKSKDSRPTPGLMRERLRQTNVLEWPAYVPMFLRTIWRTHVLRRPSSYWGPKPPGWKSWLDLPPHLIAAKQWRALVEASIRDGRRLPSENYMEIRYERLMEDPVGVMWEVAAHCEITPAPDMIDYAAGHVNGRIQERWEGALSDGQLREVEDELRPLLSELGYA